MNTVLQLSLSYIRISGKHTCILHTEFIRYGYQTLQHHLQLLILAYHARIFTIKKLYQAAHQMLIAGSDGIKIEEFGDAINDVLQLQTADLLLTRRSKLAGECIHRLTADNGSARKRLTEHHALQSLAAAQRHISLTMGKRMRSIDDGMFESKSLTLVDSYRPRQTQRILHEFSFHRLLYLLGFLVQRIFRIGPLHFLQVKLLARILTANGNLAAVFIGPNPYHLAYHTIIKTVLRVVLDEHHLCSRLQCELEIGRIRCFREIALYICCKRK